MLPFLWVVALCFCGQGPCLHAQAELKPPGQTISTSGQFIIVGGERPQRSAVASFVEEIRAVWAEALGFSSGWQFPIVVVFPEEFPRRVRSSISLEALVGDGSSLRFQLTLWDAAVVGSPELAAWVLQALACEYTARFFPPAVERPLRLAPPWFIQALTQQWLARRTPPPLHLLEGLLNAPRPPTVVSVIRQQTFSGNAAEMVTYRLLALGLLQTLRETPEGPAGLRELVGRLGEREMGLDAILAAFPSLEKADRLERQWALTLARRAVSTRAYLMTFAETHRELEKIFALESELPGRSGAKEILRGPLALLGLARARGGSHRLGRILGELLQVEIRAHPLYQPVVREYREITYQLVRRPRSNVRQRLEKNAAAAEELRQLGEAITEAVHLYEINRPAPVARPAIRSAAPPVLASWEPEPRRDALTRALDLFEEKTGTRP